MLRRRFEGIAELEKAIELITKSRTGWSIKFAFACVRTRKDLHRDLLSHHYSSTSIGEKLSIHQKKFELKYLFMRLERSKDLKD